MSVHLVGIGGIGMSGLAQLLLEGGEGVSGSDSQENPLLQKIRKIRALGISLNTGSREWTQGCFLFPAGHCRT